MHFPEHVVSCRRPFPVTVIAAKLSRAYLRCTHALRPLSVSRVYLCPTFDVACLLILRAMQSCLELPLLVYRRRHPSTRSRCGWVRKNVFEIKIYFLMFSLRSGIKSVQFEPFGRLLARAASFIASHVLFCGGSFFLPIFAEV